MEGFRPGCFRSGGAQEEGGQIGFNDCCLDAELDFDIGAQSTFGNPEDPVAL